MRKFLNLVCLLILPFFGKAAFKGEFHSVDHRINFEIKKQGTSLFVKEEHYRKKSQYKRVGKNNFRNENGDMIKMVSKEKILFKPRYGRRVYELYRHEHCNIYDKTRISRNRYDGNRDSRAYDRNQKDWDNDDKNWRNPSKSDWENDTWDENERSENNGHSSSISKNSQSIISTSLEGTWESNFPRKSVVILNTRDGIKAKFSGTDKWVSYETSEYSSKFYVDKKGNKYEFDGNGKCTWISSNGKQRIDLIKIDNVLRF